MNRRIFVFVCVMLLIVLLFADCRCTWAESDKVKITITADKNIIRRGEKLLISAKIVNKSNEEYSFSSFRFRDLIMMNAFYGMSGKPLYKGRRYKLEFGRIVMYRYIPFKEELFTLKPSQKRIFKMVFVMKKNIKIEPPGKLYYGNYLESVKGDYVKVGPEEKIIVQVKYQPSINEISAGKIYGFKNMFNGEVLSNKVIIQVKETTLLEKIRKFLYP